MSNYSNIKKTAKQIALLLLLCSLLSSCAKEYSSETPLGLRGTWQFSQGSDQYNGYVSSVYLTHGTGSNQLILTGKSNDGRQNFQITLYDDSISEKTYNSGDAACTFLYGDASNPVFQGGEAFGPFQVTITKLGTSIIIGTFTGAVMQNGTNTVQVTQGSFNVQ